MSSKIRCRKKNRENECGEKRRINIVINGLKVKE